MRGKTFWDSVLDGGMWIVGGGLLLAIGWAMLALGPTAVERWFSR